MPKKTDSFQYPINDLPLINNKHDYYNALVARYQDVRTEYVNQHGLVDEKNLVKERYTDYPYFISNDNLSATEMLFANRLNGYFAYTDTIDKDIESPFYNLDFKTVEAYPDYLATVYDTPEQGFFYINDKLSAYASVTDSDILIEMYDGKYPLLYFCETFTYTANVNTTTGAVGSAVLSSIYFNDITVDIYTEDSIGLLEKYTVYAKISNKDPHPTEKIPGEPIYKTIVITGMGDEVTKINIDGLEIDPVADLNKVIVASDDRFNENYVGIMYTGNGEIEIGFSLPYKPDPIAQTEFPIKLYVDGAWTEEKVCKVSFSNNHIQSLTTTIKIDDQDKYLDVPAEYTLRVENRYFIAHSDSLDTVKMNYLEESKTVPMHYQGVNADRYVYITDSVTVSIDTGEVPKEYAFKLDDVYSAVNGFDIPVWVYGYTSGEIRPIPADFIQITTTVKSALTYTEFETTVYTFEFDYKGTVTLDDVKLRSFKDDYKYFNASDFTLEKVSNEDGKYIINLTLSKKLFINPQKVNDIPVRILFKFTVKRKDATLLNWPANTLNETMTVTYVEDRWEIVDAQISSKLLGDAVVTYKIKDKLLNQYTDKFASDARLSPEGKSVYSSNVSKYFTISDWDIRQRLWSDNIKVITFGPIKLQFQGTVAHSDIVTIEHDEPIHPLVVTPHPKTINTNKTSRIMIDLSYNEPITGIYVNGNYLTKGVTLKLDNVKNGYGLMYPIRTADNKEIVAIGLDLIPVVEKDIDVQLVFNNVNDFDYTKWPVNSNFTIPVKAITFNFTFELIEFAFGTNSTGMLHLNDSTLAAAQVVATVKNAANEVIVARPNFNPVGNGDFKTTNLYLDDYLADQKEYYLDFELYEYAYSARDNTLPNQTYYSVRIPFTVEG